MDTVRWLAGVVWNIIIGISQVILALAAFFILAVFNNMFGTDEPPKIANGSALVLAPSGILVEQLTAVSPADRIASGGRAPSETLVRDMVTAIRRAKDDDRISTLVIETDRLAGAGASKLHYLGEVIEEFKQSGKPVIAYGGGYSQGQYLLAAHADEVLMHPMGAVLLTGYGSFPTYMRAGLEKLDINVHVFKVGTYKSAVEPLLRDDMSDEVKEANGALLGTLWDDYVNTIARKRALDPQAIFGMYASLSEDLAARDGDLAQLALDAGFVDELKTRIEFRQAMIERVGKSSGGNFKQISMSGYLAATESTEGGSDKIAVIVAAGAIADGEQKAGTVGGDTVARKIRSAMNDDAVKAIVLRVDSPGGSSFASEVIRQQLGAARDAGKPVIISMGSVAASGGYWISTLADEIWAEPTTITGSIGIFSIFFTLEDSLDKIGIHVDGVGTTPLSGAFNVTTALPDLAGDLIQQSINKGYEDFLARVGEARGMTRDQVDAIAQGRVWAGRTALDLGLVDALGNIDAAIAAAAARANTDDYRVIYIEDSPSFRDRLLNNLLTRLPSDFALMFTAEGHMERAIANLGKDARALLSLNDPNHVYAICMDCELR